MIRTLLTLCALWYSISSFAQKVWIFGQDIGLDFNTTPPTVIIPPPSVFGGPGGGNPFNYGQLGCASITDANGQLLFYTANTGIYNKNFYLMPNGNNAIYHSPTQGTVIVPMPGNTNKYYVFTINTLLDDFSNATHNGKMYYNIVDMTLDGGLGDVESGKKLIPVDSFLTGKITAVVGDKCNVWVVVRCRNNNNWKAYEITPQGLNPNPVISTAGNLSSYIAIPAYNGGQLNMPYLDGVIRFSPDRRKFASACLQKTIPAGFIRKGLELYDFDPATGIISNPITLDTAISYYGTCFSPDGTKLYGGQGFGININQWNLSLPGTAAIINSKTLVGQVNLTPANTKIDLKVAPDGKIYTPRPGGTPYVARFMHSINFPNLPGAASQFLFNALQLVPAGYNPLTAGMIPRAALPNEVAVYIHDTSNANLRIDTAVCWKPAVTVSANDTGWDYEWTDGAVGPTRVISQTGSYIVSYMRAPCTLHIDTFNVTINNNVPQISSARVNCDSNGHAIYIKPVNGDTISYAYTWMNAAGQVIRTKNYASGGDTLAQLNSGTYSVLLKSRVGCDTLLTATVDGGIHADFLQPKAACEGATVSFQNNSTGPGNFFWDFGDGQTSTDKTPVHQYGTPGVYHIMLVVSDTTMPCFDTAYSSIVIDSLPFLHVFLGKDSICEGANIEIKVNYRSGIQHLLWDFGDGLATDLNALKQFMHAFDTSGTIVIKATGIYPNCPDTSFTDTIVVFPHPIVNLGPDTFLCPGGQAIPLYNRNPDEAGNRYLWNTGDTTNRILARHHARYELTVTSAYDCISSDSVDVFKSCYIDIPNVFTPNGDGTNDYFLPRELLSKALTAFYMRIYNRWGELIFETKSINGRGWDGDYNGLAQPQGVYVYLIEATFENGAHENYQGNVTLIR